MKQRFPQTGFRRFAPLALWMFGLLSLSLATDASAGLIHRWSFDETSGTNLSDSIGANAGSVVVIAGGGGYAFSNGAVRLDGGARVTADYVNLPGNVFDGLTNTTIELWAEPHSFPSWGRVIELCEGDAAPNPTTNNFRLSWSINADGNQQRFGVRPYAASDSALATPVNQIYHYAIVWSATGGTGGQSVVGWYRNGVFVTNQMLGTYTIASFAALAQRTVWLARSPFTADSTGNDSYHELRIYSHALSPTEIFISRNNGPNSLVIPPAPASALSVATNGSTGSLTLSWTPGTNSTGSLVMMSATQSPTAQPTNGNTYGASATFGSGANLGASNFVVYAGSGSGVIVSNLVPGVRYYAAVYSASGSGASTIFNLAEPPMGNELAYVMVQSISLQVSPQMSIYSTSQATVLADFGSGNISDITASAIYSSSATNVIGVSAGGGLQAMNYGSALITASYQGKQASNIVSVLNPLTNNLTHRYTFTSDASDVVGTAHGTLQGGAVITSNQVVFNGTSAFVNLPNNLVTGYTSITIETWVTDNGSGTWGRIFDFGNNSAGEDLQGTGTQYLFLALPGGGGNLQGAITVNSGAGEQVLQWAGNRPAVGAKAHIVWAYDAATTTARLYVNGAQVGVNVGMTLTPAALGPTVNDWLGKSVWPDPYFNGAMDEFRIYNVALPASLVLTNFLNGPDGIPTSPPFVVNDAATLNPGAKVLIAVLANDTGPAGVPGTLEMVTLPSNGTAVVKPDGKILYSHNGGATTSDLFTYRVQNSLGATSGVATVTLTITKALRLAAPSLAMPSSTPATGYQIIDAFPGLTFEDALAIATPPGRTNQIFVVERRGRISYVPDINAASPERVVFLDVVNQMSFDDTVQGERGLLGMAFHPGFQTNGYFFVFYTAPGSPYIDRLARFTADPVTLTVSTNTQQIFFDVVDQEFNHNGGDLHFGNDGYLYIGMGDEGGQYNLRQNAQRIDKDLFSSLLRIDVDRKPGSVEPKPSANTTTVYTDGTGRAYYAIPPSNPFVNATTYLGSAINTNTLRLEIFATGFRHIWRFSIDKPTGEIWVGDVGQDTYEEVNVVTNGGNYGWAYLEGFSNTIALYPSQTTLLSNPPPSFVPAPPLWTYLHTARPGGDPQYKGNSISGGVVYRGTRIPELTGAYIVGDFESANIWSLFRTNNTVLTNRIAGQLGVAAFGLDPGNGDVLLANYVYNQIQRLVKTDTSTSTFPQKLSDTGAFADVATLSPSPGLVNYSPIVSFWSDKALKRRWFSIPDLTNQMTHAVDANWSLPAGMVWVKHFDLELERGNPASKKRLETRFIVKNTNGVYGVSYAWNAAGDEAFLVPDGGTNFSLSITDGVSVITQQWSIPSRSECLACHVPVAGHALSFNTRELNQTATMNGVAGNQLATLSAAGYFANPVSAPETLPAFSTATNTAYSLEHRVRAYLAVNCVQCHQPAGAGPGTWDARPWVTLAQTGLINGTPYNNGANPTNKLVVPGDLAHSVLLQRIRGNGFSRMPPLATSLIDQGATNLVTDWITSLYSAPLVQSLAVTTGAATVNFVGTAGYAYEVQRATNVWFTGTLRLWMTNAPVGGLFNIVDDFSDLGARPTEAYYRLRFVP